MVLVSLFGIRIRFKVGGRWFFFLLVVMGEFEG